MIRSITCAVLVFAAAQAVAGDEPKLGKWEYTTSMQMPGMPAMPALPPGVQLPAGMKIGGGGISRTFEHCVTKEDFVPREEKDCTVTKNDRKGGTITWAATCNTPQGKADAQGSATYTGDTMKGSTHMTGTTSDGHPFEMTQEMTGKYLGAC
jgi:hypothetical protein